MKKREFTLQDEFELRGLWSSPSNPELRVPGTLFCKSGSSRLELFGDQGALTAIVRPSEPDASKRILNGFLSDATCATCIDFFDGAAGSSSNGMSKATLSPSSLIHGTAYFTDASGIRFKESQIRIVGLEAWQELPAIFLADELRNTSPKIHLAVPKPEQHTVDCGEYQIEFGSRLQSNFEIDPPKSTLALFSHVRFQSQEPQSLDWFADKHWQFACLLSFLADHAFDFARLDYLASPSNGDETWVGYFASYGEPKGKPPKSNDFLFRMADVSEVWPSLVKAWMDGSGRRHEATYAFSSDFFNQSSGVEDRFLRLCQAFEGLDRLGPSDTYMDDSTYEKVREQMVASIPKDVPSPLRQRLIKTLQHQNEKSLRNRFKRVLSQLDEETRALICNSQSAFTQGLVETRNFLTHTLTERHESVLRGAEIYHAIEKLRILIIVMLAKELGISEATIRGRLKSNDRLKQKRNQYLQAREG